MEEHDDIELRSDEVQEILGTPPSWLVRWGTFAITIVLGIFAILSYIVKYPDVVEAPAIITTSTPPTSVVARSDGNLAKLLVTEKQVVEANEVLAVMQNTADYQAIRTVEKMVLNVQRNNFENLTSLRPDRTLQMGDIQTDYSNFIQALDTYTFSATNQFASINAEQVRQQIKRSNEEISLIKQKKSLAEDRLTTNFKQYESAKLLYAKGAVSARDLENIKEIESQIKGEIKNYESSVIIKKSEIGQLESRIMEIEQGTTISNTDKLLRLKESVNTLRASIDKWKQTFLLIAPVDGVVTFFSRVWKEQMFVKAGEEVLVVVPQEEQSNIIVAKALIPSFGSGKVKEQQRVVLYLEGYPHEEYGSIDGIVTSLSLVPKEDKYLIQIGIPGEKLITSRKKEIPQAQQLNAQARIITEDKRFIQRIFDKILGMFKKY
jgi:multidrug efflux pump subunit AcrA (membrane-fusion protein)